MTVIRQQDFIDSIEDALQFISYYHPLDYVKAVEEAYKKEKSQAAKDAMAQILINSRMSAEGKRPLCQDTGIVTCFVKVGMGVTWDKTDMTVQEMVDEGTRRAYLNPDNPLRASIVADPAGARKNTKDNTPSVVHIDMVAGEKIEVMIAAKGGGSENKSKMVMLNPSDDIADWVVKTLPTMGAGWCPPGMLGIGIGGTAEKAAVLAKESLMDPVDIQELIERGPQTTDEKLRLEIFDRVNKLGIGAQGLGGLTTVVDVKIKSLPTHAASKPVAMIPNCAATRHAHFYLDGSGPAELTPPKLEDWPEVTWEVSENTRRVNLDEVTKEDIQEWKVGETVLLSGKMLTGRDAAHKRIQTMMENGEGLPEGVDLTNRFIYYVGPVDAVGDEVV
ncbi:MAG: fumarate hydratase, partial [Pseudomonadota bacterium]|nr:fumarate hydratase [Pseudomonadota bacterium]